VEKIYIELQVIQNPFRLIGALDKFLRDEGKDRKNIVKVLGLICGRISEDPYRTFMIFKFVQSKLFYLGYEIVKKDGSEYAYEDFVR
jgi:hypothetical protein